MLEQLAYKYFQEFSNKNTDSLRSMFAQNISLRDWDNQVDGIEEVLTINQKIFDSVKTISVAPLNIFVDGNTLIAELSIEINQTELILVTDILVFDAQQKILAIRAYKG